MSGSSVELDPPRRLLMGSGPSNPEPRVLQAMAAAPLAPDDSAFGALLDDVSAFGRAVFQTRNASTLAVPGASRAGIEAVLASVIAPGDDVLIGVYGHFGASTPNGAQRSTPTPSSPGCVGSHPGW
jgi:(S)-ureidoglycine---glyoxylate transaminase